MTNTVYIYKSEQELILIPTSNSTVVFMLFSLFKASNYTADEAPEHTRRNLFLITCHKFIKAVDQFNKLIHRNKKIK